MAIDIPRAPDTTHALKASITVGVNDPSGHASLATTEIPLRPAGNLIGHQAGFAGSAVDAGTEAAFDVAAVNPGRHPHGMKAKLRLVRERPDWRLVHARQPGALRDGMARRTAGNRRDRHPGRRAVPLRQKLDFGRYRH